MRDMTRDELQDALPDLLHGRLSADDAAAVERAVLADPALMSELTMLRAVRDAHQSAPAVDVARIVNALPSPPATGVAPSVDELALRREARRPLISRKFARAAALFVVVGGGTMVTVWNGRGRPVLPAVAPITATADSFAVDGGAMQLGFGASTDDLSVDQLRALEDDIRSLDGAPSAEPDVSADLLAGEGA